MRSFLAGLILFSALVTAQSPSARGQAADGQVLALGFGDNFRPDCWTPLKVQLKSHQNEAKSYMIQIHQQDLDKDTVVYTRVVPLGPNSTTDFWAYFMPQPTGGGLSGRPLGEALKVYLYDESGKTLITPLPINCNANDFDPAGPMMGRSRGKKLVLAVIGPNDNPAWDEYAGALGLTEGVQFVPVRVDDLPGSVLGLQAVDAIVWFDAEAREISSGGTGAFEAIQQYVKQGGQLVICQPSERVRISAFSDAGMLPVETKDAAGVWLNDFKSEPKTDLQPLYDLAVNPELQNETKRKHQDWAWTDRNWDLVRNANPTTEIYRAKPKPDAVVDLSVHWGETKDGLPDETPYIARRAYGMGSVVWVAQDLGSHTLTSVRDPHYNARSSDSHASLATGGWPYVWDKVFGWNNQTIVRDDWDRGEGNRLAHPEFHLDGAPTFDLGASLTSGMEASARGAWLVTVAIFFFIIYWIVAGPGSYFFLAHRKKKGLSWTVFAAAALVATAVTVGVVKLVLRGEPEVHHITVLHLFPDAPAPDGSPRFNAAASSRFGLYIPRDGEQTVEVAGASDKEPSFVIPLAPHPGHLKDEDASGFTDTQRYTVATDAFTTGDPSVAFPYRSTLKKIQTQWIGTASDGIIGSAELVPTFNGPDPRDKNPDPKKRRQTVHGPLVGTLTNSTGRDLHDVYIAFHFDRHEEGTPPVDELLYVRSWLNGAPIDLDVEWAGAMLVSPGLNHTPSQDETVKSFRGFLSTENGGWYDYWVRGLPHVSAIGSGDESDARAHYDRSLPLMAFIDRVPPYRGVAENSSDQNSEHYRADLLRREGRDLNVSQLVAAGRLVIVAQGEGPVPYPLKVDGGAVGGEGVTFYEVSLPLTDKLRRPATRPASRPATEPAGGPATQTAAPVSPSGPSVSRAGIVPAGE